MEPACLAKLPATSCLALYVLSRPRPAEQSLVRASMAPDAEQKVKLNNRLFSITAANAHALTSSLPLRPHLLRPHALARDVTRAV